MKHLAKHNFNKLHPSIRRKFWETHRDSYAAIRQWRPVKGLKSSLRRFLPFLVFWWRWVGGWVGGWMGGQAHGLVDTIYQIGRRVGWCFLV